jgi:hypothetical protein
MFWAKIRFPFITLYTYFFFLINIILFLLIVITKLIYI